MKKRLHVSWYICTVAIGILLGVVLSLDSRLLIFASSAWLLVAACLMIVCLFKKHAWLLVFAIIAGTLIGLYRGSTERVNLIQYNGLYGKQVTVQGTIKGDPSITPSGNQQFQLSSPSIDGKPMHGTVWASTSLAQELKRGDLVEVKGQLEEGFGTFAGAMYRPELLDLERPSPGDVGRRLRDWFAAKVRLAIPEPQASLGVSYLLGQRQALPESLASELRMLGLVHLVVASGFHLTLIVTFIRSPMSKRSKYLAAALSFTAILGFLLVSGFSTSMIRASLVTGLSLLAWYYGRRIHPIILLLGVAAFTVLIRPSFIWGDIGWYLSFAAFGGVIILAPMIEKFFWGNKQIGFIKRLLVATTSAQITTLPIVALTFSQYSPLALVANLLIQPFVALAMLLTFVAGVAGAAAPAITTIVGWPASALLSYMLNVTDWLSGLSLAEGEVTFSISALFFCYAALFIASLALWHKTKHSFRGSSASILE